MAVRSLAAALAAVAGLCVIALPAFAGHLTAYHYSVLRDGDPIGLFQFKTETQGKTRRVEVSGDIAVTLGGITLYRLEHRRSELWQDDLLVESVAHTDKNGDVFEIEITREPEGYKRVLNGETETFDASVGVLALWHQSLLLGGTFISPMDDKVLSLEMAFQSEEEIDLGAGPIAVKHYKMTGDSERDIWFDAAGQVVKVRFTERLSEIEYRLEEVNGVAAEASGLPGWGAALAASHAGQRAIPHRLD